MVAIGFVIAKPNTHSPIMTERANIDHCDSKDGEQVIGDDDTTMKKHPDEAVSSAHVDDELSVLKTKQTEQTTPSTNIDKKDDERAKPLNVPNTTSSAHPQAIPTEQQLLKAKRDLENMVLKYAKSERDNLQNIQRVNDLDKKLSRAIKDNDSLANRIKILTKDKTQLTDTLNAKMAQLTVLEQKNVQFTDGQVQRLKECEDRLKELESQNENLLKQIESHRSKEGELLEFSERLSMKHLLLQSELADALKRVPSCTDDFNSIVKERDELIALNKQLEEELMGVNAKYNDENKALVALKASHAEQAQKHRNTIDALENEIKVMRRKHQITVRELMKRLKQVHEDETIRQEVDEQRVEPEALEV